MSDPFHIPVPTAPAQGAPGQPVSGLPGVGAQTKAPPPSSVRDSSFDLHFVAHVVLKRLWLLVAIVLVVPTAVWLYVRKLPREYQATASMVLDSTTPQYLGPQFRDVVDFEHGSWWSAYEYMETQFRIIRSRRVAGLVAKELCRQTLTDRMSGAQVPALLLLRPGTSCEDDKAIEEAIPVIQPLISVQGASRNNRVVELTAVGTNPELVALLANTYVRTYIEANLRDRMGASSSAAGWLGSQFSTLQDQLTQAEASLVKFKTDNALVNLDEQQSDLGRKQRTITDKLEAVRLELIALRPLHQRLAEWPGPLPDPESDPLQGLPPSLNENETISALKTMYKKAIQAHAELAEKYLEKHPKLATQETLIRTLREDLRREIQMVRAAALSRYEMLSQQEQELKRVAAEATSEALALQKKIIQYNQLKLHYDRLRKTAETVGGRESDSLLASRLATNNVRLLDPALVPLTPIAPNVRQAVLTALGIALALAIALAFLLELSDNTVKSQDDMEQVLHIPFLGMIPHLPDEPGEDASAAERPPQKDLFIARHPKSTVAECCRVIRTNLLFMSTERPIRTLLVTSAGPQEGKSMSSVSLALSMAQSGSKVLLVDTDMRRPRLHKVFGIASGGVGLTTAIAGTLPALQAVRPTEQPNLFLLACGPMPPNPAELLQTERFKQIVGELSAAFDKVIFDSPPIGAVTDALVLSQVTDGVVLVAKSHKTSREMLRRARRQLQDLNAPILGCVLNDLDLDSRRRGYGYPYYYYYKSGYYRYGYYASEEGDEGKPKGGPGDGPGDGSSSLLDDVNRALGETPGAGPGPGPGPDPGNDHQDKSTP